jgi:glucose-1-phosphate adenylyltransferase
MSLRYAVILAGGMGSRLCLLAATRAKPAVPFGGRYRIIDFTLSNCVNSGIYDVSVLTQYRPGSLNDHIGTGRAWDLDRRSGGIELLQPYIGWQDTDWYRGTADAVYQNLVHIRERHVDDLLILSGDHVYKMDYSRMYDFHRSTQADLTLAVTTVAREATAQLGIVELDANGRAIGFQEKPARPRALTASMGVYIFRMGVLEDVLADIARRGVEPDFGKSIIPQLVSTGAVYGYVFDDYWQDIGTVDSYYDATMDLVSERPKLDLHDRNWIVHAVPGDAPPSRFSSNGEAEQSLIAQGSIIRGRVERSVLFAGVVVEEGARVSDSIVMHGSWIGPDATLDRVIVDKAVHVGAGAIVGHGTDMTANRSCPDHLSTGISIVGKGTRLPEGQIVGRNCRVGPGLIERQFTGPLASGEAIDSESP